MKEAPLPRNEAERLEALRRYDILDTLPEQAYDDITTIASQICATPISAVSLVDRDRQWFKSTVGLDATQTPRDIAFCAHAILEPDRVLVVEDATQDARFHDNPLVTGDLHIRFYAGAPLVASGGEPLGTLCVIDRESRSMSEGQRESLRALSRQVVAQLELRRTVSELQQRSQELRRSHDALRERTDQVERSRDQLVEMCRVLEGQAQVIEHDLHRAEVIQRSLLPHSLPEVGDFCVQTLYRPGRSVGGDLFDVVRIGGRHVALVIADAAGHGVSAAMLSVLFKNRLRVVDEETGRARQPAEILTRVNASLLQDMTAPGVFVTAVCCLLDTETRELTVASAGHTPQIWLKARGGTELLERTGPALGLYEDARFEERRVQLAPHDRLLLYTDGLFDFGRETSATVEDIAETLSALGDDDRVLEQVLFRLSRGQERADRDDVTMLLLNACPGESHFDESECPAERHLEPEPEQEPVTAAEAGSRRFLCLHGRVTWTWGPVLLEEAKASLEAGRSLVIDLGDCESLDSTMLGTLHEVVQRARAAGGEVQIQRPREAVVAAFEELHLRQVCEHIARPPFEVPTQCQALQVPEGAVAAQQRRLLEAHQVLASLSDENREQFGPLVDMLRSQMKEPGAS